MALEQSGTDWSCESVIAEVQNFATLTRNLQIRRTASAHER